MGTIGENVRMGAIKHYVTERLQSRFKVSIRPLQLPTKRHMP